MIHLIDDFGQNIITKFRSSTSAAPEMLQKIGNVRGPLSVVRG